MLFWPLDEGPQHDDRLSGHAQQINQCYADVEVQEGDVDGRKDGPHQGGDNDVIVAAVEPDGVKYQSHDQHHGQSVQKVQPLEGGLLKNEGGDNEGKHGHYPAHAFRDICDHAAVVRGTAPLLPVEGCIDRRRRLGGTLRREGIKGHPEQCGDLHQDRNIRGGLCALPFGDRLVGIIQLFCQLQLGHVMPDAKLGYIFCNDAFDIFHSNSNSFYSGQRVLLTKLYHKKTDQASRSEKFFRSSVAAGIYRSAQNKKTENRVLGKSTRAAGALLKIWTLVMHAFVVHIMVKYILD